MIAALFENALRKHADVPDERNARGDDCADRIHQHAFDLHRFRTRGNEPTRVRFLPPMGVLTTNDIDAVCDILEKTLTKVAQS